MSVLGKYQLLRELGRGGMARVYLAETFGASGFEKRVAVKVLHPEHRGVAELERLLIEEAKLGARLSHRNLVAVHELSVIDGSYVVCMEYVDGADLGALLAGELPPLELVLLVAEELALALDYVHAAGELGLVHRDVSPSNILVSRAGEVKLADLGIAKATTLAEVTRGNVRKGKYAYMSPEQVAGKPLRSSSDLFSLGIVLYQLLMGRRPFDGDSVLATMENIKRAEPPPVDGIRAEVAPIVTRLLQADPARRYSSAAELQRDLQAVRWRLPVSSPLDLASWVTARLS